MRDHIRRPLAAVMCACLLLSDAGLASRLVFAQAADQPQSVDGLKPKGVSSREVLAYLERQGVFQGENAILREYVGSDTFTTPLGAVLYRHLKAQANPKEEVESLKPALETLAKSGPYTPNKGAVFQKQFQRYMDKFKGLPDPVQGDLEDTFQTGTLREAFMTGAASVDAPKAKYMQIDLPNGQGWKFLDEKGLAVKLDGRQKPVFRRDVQEMQRALNKARPSQAPFIPETGQYNHQIFEVSWWRLKLQVEQLDLAMRLDRMVNMAELLGVQVKDQKWFDRNDPSKVNADLEKDLAARADKQRYAHKGRDYSVLDIVNAKTKVRRSYLNKAVEGLDHFKSEADKLHDPEAITDQKIRAMQLSEQYVMRYVSLAYVETQRHAVRNQLERLDSNSPDSALVKDSLNIMPLDYQAKEGYKKEREKMRARLERMLVILGRTEDALFKTDYASSLDIAQAALGQTQKEITELGQNYELYVSVPGLLQAMSGQRGGILPRFVGNGKDKSDWLDPRMWTWGWGRGLAAGSRVNSSYTQGMKAVEDSMSGYEGIARQIAKGDYHGARKSVIAMNPEAALNNPTISLTGETPKLTDQVRLAAALKETRETLARVTEINRWVDMGQSIITWSVTVGFSAPVASKGLAWVETHGSKLHLGKWQLKTIPALAEQLRLKLDSLNPSQEMLNHERMRGPVLSYLRNSGYRSLNFGVRQLAFTGLSGGISGGFTAVSHWMDESPVKLNLGIVKIGENTSNFSDGWDAFKQGSLGGMEWANQSFHPALGYIGGIPSSRFEGTALAGAADIVGSRGVTGIAGQFVKWGAGKVMPEAAYNRLSGWGARLAETATTWGRTAAAKTGEGAVSKVATKLFSLPLNTLAIVDNVGKFALVSQGVGYVSKQASWYWNHDEADVRSGGELRDVMSGMGGGTPEEMQRILGLERRIKRANATGMAWADSPMWLLLPIFPAKYEDAARGAQRSMQGEREYIKDHKEADLANATADQTYLTMRGHNKPPLMQRIFNFNAKGSWESESTFLVSKEAKRRAIDRKLKEHVSGGDPEADLATLNPEAFLKISRSDPQTQKMVGELFNTEDVHIQARKLCVEALLRNEKAAVKFNKTSLAELILSAKPGAQVEGFGNVSPAIQREVAAMMRDELPKGAKISAKLQALAQGFIKSYMDSNSVGKAGGPAEIYLKKAAPLRNQTKEQAEAYVKSIREMRDIVAKWVRDEGLQAKTAYPKLAQEFHDGIKAKFQAGQLTREQFECLDAMFNLISAQEARFQSFNKVDTVTGLINDELAALRMRYQSNAPVQKLLGAFETRLASWRDSVPAAERPTAAAAGSGFKKMIGDFNQGISKAVEARTISEVDAAVLREAVQRDMAGAPWILHDSKGTSLTGWRPGQFSTYFDALTKIAMDGEPSRAFLRLTTGGGKTLLTFEGLFPLAEADARMSGRKVTFFTVQSNLEAQAQLEWRALRKIGSELEFGTYEDLKAEIAEAKNKGKTHVDKLWILGDEMDGAALQPALTLGETTGRITRQNSVFVRLDELNRRMEKLLLRDAEQYAERVKSQARRAQAAIDGLDAATPGSGEARAATENLIKAAEGLGRAVGPEARARAEAAVRLRLSELGQAVNAPELAGTRARVDAALGEAGRILDQGPAMEASTRKAAAQEIADTLKRQRNLLPLVQGDAQARLEGLRMEARGLRENAQARLETIGRKLAAVDAKLASGKGDRAGLLANKAALESEVRLARGEIQFAQRFEVAELGRAQRLVERLFELQTGSQVDRVKLDRAQRELAAARKALSPEQNAALDVYSTEVSKLYDVGRRMAAIDEQVLQAARSRRPVEGLQKDLYALQSEADGIQTRMALAREQAKPRASEADIRAQWRHFNETGQDILDLVNKGDADSHAMAMRMLAKRKALLEAFAGTENPLYDVYRRMKADAYSVANSPLWNRDEAKAAEQAGAKAKELMTAASGETAQGLQSVEGLAKAGESEGAAKLRKQAADMLRGQAQRWQELMGRQTGGRAATLDVLKASSEQTAINATERQRFLKALRKQQSALEGPVVDRLESVMRGVEMREAALKSGVDLQARNLEMTQDRAVGIYERKVNQLTRKYALEMAKGILTDPLMPAGQRDILLAKTLSSYLFPKLSTDSQTKGSSWVRTEFTNLVRGYFDDPATVRMDNLSGKTNVIHNGQWFETMDNPTRRFWELEYGTDITLPYTHKALSTIKDVTSTKKARFFALSATAGEEYVKHLQENGVDVLGVGAEKPGSVAVDVRNGQYGKIASAGQALQLNQAQSRNMVAVRPGEVLSAEAAAPPEVRAYMEAQGYAKKDGLVLELDKLPQGPVRDYFTMLRGQQPASTSLTVISVPNTKALKLMYKYLIKSGLAKENEIAKVFSDSEYLRLNRPQANVQDQMNLDGMKTGQVKILILDTVVGGRGLDLDFKGDRGDPRPNAFKGYTNYEMLVMDPNKMSAVHLLQSQGRISTGRVLAGARRNFRLVMDVKDLQTDHIFQDMYRSNDTIAALRDNPVVREFARQRNAPVDLALIDAYVKQAELQRFDIMKNDPAVLEFAGQKGRPVDPALVGEYMLSRQEAAKKSGNPADLAWVNERNVVERYNQAISDSLERRQQLIESDQLTQSSVKQDRPVMDPKLRWLDRLQYGR